MSKLALGILGIFLILLGVAGLITNWDFLREPKWLAWIEIVVGLVAVFIVASDSRE